jgi:hypothetical protein
MKRVPLTQKDYPENFNKVAKYIAKKWIDKKLQLEESRQILAKVIGYNSIHELEKTFVNKLPNLMDIDNLISGIRRKMEDEYNRQWREANAGYHLASAKWGKFNDDIFPKIPFYLLEALDKSKDDIFAGTYDKVADRMSLYIQNYRYGGYYGIFIPYVDRAGDIDNAIDYDKTANLISFFGEYECFPFGRGDSHISVITEISERVDKYFDEDGNWKLRVRNEDGYELHYFEVIDEILSWFEEDSKTSSGTPWYVIDSRKGDNHWLFKALDDAVSELKNNDYKRVPDIVEDEDEEISSASPKTTPFLIMDEFHSAASPDFANIFESTGGLRGNDNRQSTKLKDTTGTVMKVGDNVVSEGGDEYKVDCHINTDDFFLYNVKDLKDTIRLKDYEGKLTIKNPFVATQSISDL